MKDIIIHWCVVYKGFVFIVFLTMVTLDKEHDRDKRPSRTQISVVSEHANKTEHCTLWEEVITTLLTETLTITLLVRK